MRWRSSSFLPSKALDTTWTYTHTLWMSWKQCPFGCDVCGCTKTLKCDSEPAGTLCLLLSLTTSSSSGSKALVNFSSTVVCTGPVAGALCCLHVQRQRVCECAHTGATDTAGAVPLLQLTEMPSEHRVVAGTDTGATQQHSSLLCSTHVLLRLV